MGMRTLKRKMAFVAAAVVAAGVSAITYQASAAEGPSLQPPAGLTIIGQFVVGNGTQTYTCSGGKFTGSSTPEPSSTTAPTARSTTSAARAGSPPRTAP